MGQTAYPKAFIRIGTHWLVYTYPVGPLVVEGRVLVPVRTFAELFEAKVEWNGRNVVVARAGQTASFTPALSPSVSANGAIQLPRYGSLLVPLRSLLVALGFDVAYRKTAGAVTVFVSGKELVAVESYIRDKYPGYAGHNTDGMAASELDSLTPVDFSLNPLHKLPVDKTRPDGGAIYAPGDLYARPKVTFRFLGQSTLKRGRWGVYIPEGTGPIVNKVGYNVMLLSDGTITQHPCAASGTAVAPGGVVECRFETWREFDDFPVPPGQERPLRRVLIRIVQYR